MNLSKSEFEMIEKAELAQTKSRNSTLMLLLILAVGFLAFIDGMLTSELFAILCCAFSLLVVSLLLIHGPRYQDLVKLLVNIKSSAEIEPVDPIIPALSRKP